jgi:arylsulfatase
MELYAGMVDNMDANIGRLMYHLKEIGQFENTVIVFLSDNGAAAEDFYHHPYFGPFLQEHYTEEYTKMGSEESFISYGPQWAEAGASPFKYFKGYTTQGGINTPLVISGPGIEKNGSVVHAFATVMDLAPTFYEMAGTAYPDSFGGREVYPLWGRSLKSLLSGEQEIVHPTDYVFALEHRGFIQIRKGNWKLVNVERPFNESNFELYDLSVDRAEQRDVKEVYPEIYQELLGEWHAYRDEMKVRIPTPEPGEGL